jgi:hypothetical protein
LNDVIVILLLMALAVLACIAQNWWDKMTAEDRMSNALIIISVSVLIISVTGILLIFI